MLQTICSMCYYTKLWFTHIWIFLHIIPGFWLFGPRRVLHHSQTYESDKLAKVIIIPQCHCNVTFALCSLRTYRVPDCRLLQRCVYVTAVLKI